MYLEIVDHTQLVSYYYNNSENNNNSKYRSMVLCGAKHTIKARSVFCSHPGSMDSSSIVSFNNDSTLQNTIKPEYTNVNVHELALHAMRDRCLLLQRRINSLETDNMRLKLDITKNTECSPFIPLEDKEKFTLHQKIAELNKERSQLMHHIFMVSCENKNLWSKIAAIKKVDSQMQGNKPLLRTNTYINSTPKTTDNQEKFSESSLEEISLKLISSYIQEKSQIVEQCAQMTQLQEVDEFLNVDSIGFNFMEDPATDSLKEIRIQTQKMHDLKKELVRQEQEMQLIVTKVERIINGECFFFDNLNTFTLFNLALKV